MQQEANNCVIVGKKAKTDASRERRDTVKWTQLPIVHRFTLKLQTSRAFMQVGLANAVAKKEFFHKAKVERSLYQSVSDEDTDCEVVSPPRSMKSTPTSNRVDMLKSSLQEVLKQNDDEQVCSSVILSQT